MISYLLFLSKNIYWHGDWAWGPRYILALTPFFIIPLAELFDSHAWGKRKFIRLAIYSIFILGLIIQIAAVSVDFQKYFLQLHYEKKVKFTEKHGNGALPIVEPPADTYFDWHKSPILAQFISIHEIAKGIKNYRYSELPDDTTNAERIKARVFMNVFDFWWLYKYYVDGSYSGFVGAFILLIIAVYTSVRIWQMSRGS
jgi:hypothetical protein